MINHQLYLVTDEPSRYAGDWLDQVVAAVEGGVTCVQYRDTESPREVQYERILKLKDALAKYHIPIIVNNDAELAAAVRADGVHVGQRDLPVAAVRQLVGANCEIGLSITSLADFEHLKTAEAAALPDCLGIGPVFDARKTKADASEAMGLEGLAAIVKASRNFRNFPTVAIGGITLDNAASVFATGVGGIAVVSAFSKSPDPCTVARQFLHEPRITLHEPRITLHEPRISPCCLTIAGSDSGGNAGVQADLRAFHAYGLHGCTVFAALTAQNPFGVSAIHSLPADFVAAQLDAVLGVYSISALKTGMLGDPAVIEVIADRLKAHPEIAKVIDPVMVATSGARLVSAAAMQAIEAKLMPLATILTPNLPEAEVLCYGTPLETSDRGRTAAEASELAKRLADRFGCAVLVKGGHGQNAAAVDVLACEGKTEEFSAAWIDHPISTHGTGCSLAAALAAELALGRGTSAAVKGAKQYVHEAIAASYYVGRDCGVLGFCRQ